MIVLGRSFLLLPHSLALLMCMSLAALAEEDLAATQVELKQGDRIIFFGDSLTNLAGEEQPKEQVMKGYVEHTHQAFLVSMNMDYPDTEFLLRPFESGNPDNFAGIQNKALDGILKKARTEQDKKLRQTLYSDALKIIESEFVTVNLFHPRANYWTNNCVEGFASNILADVYIDYSAIKIIGRCESIGIQRAGL